MNMIIWLIQQSFNTSYVVIKRIDSGDKATGKASFNTSYVVIKQHLRTVLAFSTCFNTSYVVIKLFTILRAKAKYDVSIHPMLLLNFMIEHSVKIPV